MLFSALVRCSFVLFLCGCARQGEFGHPKFSRKIAKGGLEAWIEGKDVDPGALSRELRQGLLGPSHWVTREVLAVTPMVFPTRRGTKRRITSVITFALGVYVLKQNH